MPIFLALLGVALVIIGVRGKTNELVDILRSDFVPSAGNPSFIPWIAAFVLIGLAGSVSKTFRPVTDTFAILVILVILITNKGFIAQFERQALQ